MNGGMQTAVTLWQCFEWISAAAGLLHNPARSRAQVYRVSNRPEVACYDRFAAIKWALNSAVECHPHTVEVIGSNPIAPTIYQLEASRLSHRMSRNRIKAVRQ